MTIENAQINELMERQLVSTRILNAPPALVYKAWTTPEYLAQWWGPQGFTNTFHTCDIKNGGAWTFDMHGPDGTNYPNRNTFREVTPERIIIDHLSNPVFTLIAHIEEWNQGTKLTFRQVFHSDDDYSKVRPIAHIANEQNIDRMEAVLERIAANEQVQVKNTTPVLPTHTIPYITFTGNCKEAITFYHQCFGGDLTIQLIKDSPMADQCGDMPGDFVMHASLSNNQLRLMASDMTGPDGVQAGNNISICIQCNTEEEIRKFFKHLSQNGQIIDDLKVQFWGGLFGVLKDQFGINWLFNYTPGNN